MQKRMVGGWKNDDDDGDDDDDNAIHCSPVALTMNAGKQSQVKMKPGNIFQYLFVFISFSRVHLVFIFIFTI